VTREEWAPASESCVRNLGQKTGTVLAGRTDRRTSGVGLGMKDNERSYRRSELAGENRTTGQRSGEGVVRGLAPAPASGRSLAPPPGGVGRRIGRKRQNLWVGTRTV